MYSQMEYTLAISWQMELNNITLLTTGDERMIALSGERNKTMGMIAVDELQHCNNNNSAYLKSQPGSNIRFVELNGLKIDKNSILFMISAFSLNTRRFSQAILVYLDLCI